MLVLSRMESYLICLLGDLTENGIYDLGDLLLKDEHKSNQDNENLY